MPIFVVGGSGRSVGKTTLVCGLIAVLPEYRWIAMKITRHVHGERKPVWEETEPGEGTDTARYLAAGAQQHFL
jgi:molybdopterin-guanine dinucleotide biosynthesis protein